MGADMHEKAVTVRLTVAVRLSIAFIEDLMDNEAADVLKKVIGTAVWEAAPFKSDKNTVIGLRGLEIKEIGQEQP
jgi:hypothetical protein